jgi:xanthine dehydrogenase molybdopterin-binding subunit B
VERGRQADDARAVHVQDPDRQRHAARVQRAAVPHRNVEDSIHRSKAVGEPPLLLPFSVFFAVRDAIAAVGDYRVNPPLDAPATGEAILRAVHAVRAASAARAG